MEFLQVGKKFIGIKVREDGKELWLECADSEEHKTTAQQVYEFAGKSLKKGDEIEAEEFEEGGKRYVTRVNKKNSTTSKSSYTPPPSESKKYYSKSPAEQELIKRQAIGHMTARTLIALQGQINFNNLLGKDGWIETIYKKYQELVG